MRGDISKIISKEKKLCEKYSKDRSIYKIVPSYVAFPRNENDVVKIVNFAIKNKLKISPRGGGTGLSGAALGKDIVIDFTKYMNKVNVGKITKVQPGILLKKLKPILEKNNLMLPSVPLHGNCAIGGNISTRSVGPRTVKYGPINNQIQSLRGVLSDGTIIDTSKKIPPEIENKIKNLKDKIKKEKDLIKYIKKRPMLAGGYNLRSLIETANINEIVKDLIIGSTGTLVLLTEIRLKLPRYKKINSLYLIYFENYNSLQKCLNKILKMNPASVEYADRKVLELWGDKYQEDNANSVLIVAFENNKNINNLKKDSIKIRTVSRKESKELWEARAMALPKLEDDAKKKKKYLPSGIDDTTFHPKHFSKIIEDVNKYANKHKLIIASFGHIGVGSLHLRAFINLRKNKNKFDKLGKDIFKIVKKNKGTLIGEHNSGLCRSRYLKMESGKMYSYMKKIKKIFDNENVYNPKVMFNLDPVTSNMDV